MRQEPGGGRTAPAGAARGGGQGRRRPATPADRRPPAGGGCGPHSEAPRRVATTSRPVAEDIRREERLAADNAGSLERLDREEEDLTELLADAGDAAIEAQERLGEASEKLTESERRLTIATAERAEAQALRNQVERRMRDLADRRARLDRQLSTERSELEALDEKLADMPDPEERRGGGGRRRRHRERRGNAGCH